jgi:hypothetical protein
VAQQEIDCKALLGKNNRISTDVFFKSSGCTKNQPGIPILRPFRGTNKSQPDCLQVPSREIEVTVRATPLLLGLAQFFWAFAFVVPHSRQERTLMGSVYHPLLSQFY